MTHKGTVTLETERLLLRRFAPDDAAAMFRNCYSDPEYMRWLPWEPHGSAKETADFLSGYISGYDKSDFYAWAIVICETGEPIGFIDTYNDEQISEIRVDYGIGKNWWHMGYTSEALAAVISFLFEQVGVNRVCATHDPRNPNSGAVMRKCGMRYEGTRRQARYRKGEYSDRVMYAILAEEYFGAVASPYATF
jgi:ribosomal-protein-alanine N-acetyltransferase